MKFLEVSGALASSSSMSMSPRVVCRRIMASPLVNAFVARLLPGSVAFDGHCLDDDRLARHVLELADRSRGHLGDGTNDVHALHHLAEHGVAVALLRSVALVEELVVLQ